jgi:hypothetical protein
VTFQLRLRQIDSSKLVCNQRFSTAELDESACFSISNLCEAKQYTVLLAIMSMFEKGFRRVADVVNRLNDPKSAASKGSKHAGIPDARGIASERANGLKYQPLSSESYEIRMLTLQERPVNDITTEEIKCAMDHVSLLTPGEYTALSYCWGETSNKVPVSINGVRVEVTVNLRAALHQLWLRGHRRVWIDAICINQDDREERSLQVRNMRLIYSKAREVVSWIGHAELKDALVIKILIENDRALAMQHKLYPKIEHEGPRLQAFFHRPYWKRVWVIQEVAVAPMVTMLYGSVDISWERLACTLNNWREYPTFLPVSIDGSSYAMQLLDFRHRVSVLHQPISLMEAIKWSHNTLATDPRDKIFALLGVAFDGPALVPLPNYKQGLDEILEDLTIALVVADKSLDLICTKETFSDMIRKSPSWMLDLLEMWSRPKPFLSHLILNERRNYSSMPPMERLPNGILKVSGRLLDDINSISTADMRPPIPGGIRNPFAAPRYRLYGSYAGITDAVWKSLTLGAFPWGNLDDINNNLETFRACFTYLWTVEGRETLKTAPRLAKWLDDNSSFKLGKYTLEEMSQLKDESTPSAWATVVEMFGKSKKPFTPMDWQYFLDSMHCVVEGSMRLMMTTGGYIGMAHPAARLGDEICCIKGCSVPVILRKAALLPDNTPTYYAIGASYVHGVSDGPPAEGLTSQYGNAIRAPKDQAKMFGGYKEFLLC